MPRLSFCLLLPLVILGQLVLAQSSYPTYSPPLSGPLLVSGTFGELRSNHYHAGIDFRAPSGTPVRSVGAGFVSRIKIQAGGYGQAVYVDHPEGYRSVYAHLSSLTPELLDTVRAWQYANESFAADLRFDSLAFPLAAGQRIGAVGNRGYSFGAHLHFELRSRTNDAALNPLLFGIRVPDRRSPRISSLIVYERGPNGRVVRQRKLTPQRVAPGRYRLDDTLSVATDRVEFAIKTYDRQDALPNKNGPYTLELHHDSILTYGLRFDSIPFEETRCLNALVDYAEWTNNRTWYHRLHPLVGRAHPYLETRAESLLPSTFEGISRVTIEVADFAENRSRLELTLRRERTPPPAAPAKRRSYYQLPWSEPSLIQTDDLTLEFPAGSLYEDLAFSYAADLDSSAGVLSRVHHLHQRDVPLHEPALLRLQPLSGRVPYGREDKVILARCDSGSDPVSYGSPFNEAGQLDFLPIDRFGSYVLLLDERPPRIKALGRNGKVRAGDRLRFEITDDVGVAGRARGLRYFASLSNEWILMEYDLKNDQIYLDLPATPPADGWYLRITVIDDRDNAAYWSGKLLPR